MFFTIIKRQTNMIQQTTRASSFGAVMSEFFSFAANNTPADGVLTDACGPSATLT
jgi:hypothetical protein